MDLFSTARWIWNGDADGPNRYVNFYASFSLPAEGEGPVLHAISVEQTRQPKEPVISFT